MSSVADVNHNGGGGIKVAKDSSVTVGDVGSGSGGTVPNGRHQPWTDNSEFSDSRGKLVSRDSWGKKSASLARSAALCFLPSRRTCREISCISG